MIRSHVMSALQDGIMAAGLGDLFSCYGCRSVRFSHAASVRLEGETTCSRIISTEMGDSFSYHDCMG